MITATLLNDRELGYTTITETASVSSAQKFFRVNTEDPDIALQASGLPAIGSTFSPSRTYLKLTQRTTRPLGGTDAGSSGGGHTVVQCDYSSPDPQPTDTNVDATDTFSRYQFSESQVPIRYDIALAPIAETTKQLTTVELIVVTYSSTLLIQHWATIRDQVNSNVVLIPAIFGVPATQFAALPGQLLALAPEIRPVRDGLLETSWRFAYAPDFKFRWRKEDETGTPVGAIVQSDIYTSVSYPYTSMWGVP